MCLWLYATVEGVVKLQRVAQDGMRVRASTGASSVRRGRTLDAYLEDPEARVMKSLMAPARFASRKVRQYLLHVLDCPRRRTG